MESEALPVVVYDIIVMYKKDGESPTMFMVITILFVCVYMNFITIYWQLYRQYSAKLVSGKLVNAKNEECAKTSFG